MMPCLVNIRRKKYLVTEAHGQLVEGHGVRTVGSEENLELDGLVNMETGRLELGLTLNWSQRERERKHPQQSLQHIESSLETCATLNIDLYYSLFIISLMLEALDAFITTFKEMIQQF